MKVFLKNNSATILQSGKSEKSSKEVFLKLNDSKNSFRLALCFNNKSVRAEGKSKLLRIIEAIKLNKIGAAARKT